MDNEQENQVTTEENPYIPRPWWQVWGARLLLIAFLVLIIMYYFAIARGGL